MGRCKFVNTTMGGYRFFPLFISLVNYCSEHNDSKDISPTSIRNRLVPVP